MSIAPTEWLLASRKVADEADPAVMRAAGHCALDWFGVAIAGAAEPVSRILADVVAPPGSSGAASVLGRSERTSPVDAALINGATGHALDYDDSNMAMPGHATGAVLPTVLALAEEDGAGGEQVLRGLIAGVEAECRLGALVGPSHYTAGFHASSTLGAFGAAAAACQILDLGEDEWRRALGLAAAHAAGLKAQFGTMAKPLHLGIAAAAGVRSARLAQAGFTAAPDVVETEQGFAAAYHGELVTSEEAEARLGGEPAVMTTVFKYHAACHLTHASIENAQRLSREGVAPADIEAITLEVPETALGVCNIAAPSTGTEGKFSLRATAALGFLGADTASPATYVDEAFQAPQLISLRDRVEVDPVPGRPLTWSRMRLRTSDGRELTAEFDVGTPERDLDAREQRLIAKFHAITEPLLPSESRGELVESLKGLAVVDSIGRLMELTKIPVRI